MKNLTLKTFYLNNSEEAYKQADVKDILIAEINDACEDCHKGNICVAYELVKNMVSEIQKIGRRVYS